MIDILDFSEKEIDLLDKLHSEAVNNSEAIKYQTGAGKEDYILRYVAYLKEQGCVKKIKPLTSSGTTILILNEKGLSLDIVRAYEKAHWNKPIDPLDPDPYGKIMRDGINREIKRGYVKIKDLEREYELNNPKPAKESIVSNAAKEIKTAPIKTSYTIGLIIVGIITGLYTLYKLILAFMSN